MYERTYREFNSLQKTFLFQRWGKLSFKFKWPLYNKKNKTLRSQNVTYDKKKCNTELNYFCVSKYKINIMKVHVVPTYLLETSICFTELKSDNYTACEKFQTAWKISIASSLSHVICSTSL